MGSPDLADDEDRLDTDGATALGDGSIGLLGTSDAVDP
jgi:hypothetical protein